MKKILFLLFLIVGINLNSNYAFAWGTAPVPASTAAAPVLTAPAATTTTTTTTKHCVYNCQESYDVISEECEGNEDCVRTDACNAGDVPAGSYCNFNTPPPPVGGVPRCYYHCLHNTNFNNGTCITSTDCLISISDIDRNCPEDGQVFFVGCQ